jgi:hypothetical protein
MHATMARRIWYILIGVTLFSVIWPWVTVVLKLAADDFTAWNRVLGMYPLFNKFVADYPFIDIRQYSLLSDISWHQPYGIRSIITYIQHSTANAVFLGIYIVARRFLISIFNNALIWLHSDGYSREKRITAGTIITIVLVFHTKLFLGFWFAGIAGWHYSEVKSAIQPANRPHLEIARESFLYDAVRLDNAQYFTDYHQIPGFLPGSAMFLHFSDGSIRVANYELVEVVFPWYLFGELYQETNNSAMFINFVRHGLDDRRANRNFLAPLNIAYPNHTPYIPINYQTYPSSTHLQQISFWRIVLYIDQNKHAYITNAYLVHTIPMSSQK